MSTILKRYYRLNFPSLSVHQSKEAVATYTIYSDVPDIASSTTQAQFYRGQESCVYTLFKIKIDKKMLIH